MFLPKVIMTPLNEPLCSHDMDGIVRRGDRNVISVDNLDRDTGNMRGFVELQKTALGKMKSKGY